MKKWMYRLMEKPPGEGGDPGKTPADPPKKGDPPKPADPPKTISVDVLPAELRDRPEAEQKFILEHMVQSISKQNRTVDELKTQLAEMKGRVEATPPKPAAPDPHEGKTLTELMLEDADTALDRYMEKKGYVKAFDTLSGRVNSTEFQLVRAEIDDFEEYEEDVVLILKESGLPATRDNVKGAYTMAVGAKTLAEKKAGKRGGGGTIPPTPPPAPGGGDNGEVKWKSSLEQEIAAAHGVSDPKDWYEHAPDKPMKLKLPT